MREGHVIKLLLSHRADPSIGDNVGWTPLHWAVGLGDVNIVELLLKHGADLTLEIATVEPHYI
ncbi:ankyrin repeat domain-containing protein [Caldivirga sp.]|uniref:ankyrin repeat domain-containing protein n=1 Tax=Caldivirga sp. TaxID=2080243 RepID=UPI003D09595A